MGGKVKQLKNCTTEQIEVLFERDSAGQSGVKLYVIIQLSRGYSSRRLEEFYRTGFKQICNRADRFDAEGLEGLRIRAGRGRHCLLTEEQKCRLQGALLKTPEIFGYSTSSRSGPLSGEHIKKTFNVSYRQATVYKLMHEPGFSVSAGKGNLFRKRRKQTPGGRNRYKKTLARCAKNHDTAVLFEDEFSLSNTATPASTWRPVNEQPKIQCTQKKRGRVTGWGSIHPLTGQLVAGFAQSGNTQTFKKHLRKVLYTCRGMKKIILYPDNVRFDHAGALRPFLKAHPELEIRYLPAYSPDFYPVERVWWYMRKSITHNRFLIDLKERIACFRRLFSSCIRPNHLLKNICVINY
jgi:transposase